MSSEQHIPVAKLGRPHGISGAFRFQLTRVLKSKKKLPPHFYIQTKGKYIPFFVASITLNDMDSGLLNLEEITNPETAKLYSGSQLFLLEKDVKTFFKEDAEENEFLIGYTIVDETEGRIGVITELLDTPAQVLATVKGEGKEFTIPLVHELIVEINKRKKEVVMNLPQGLLEI